MSSFGLYLPQIGHTFPQIREAATAAASLGFRHVWFIDHFEVPGYGGVMEGWTLATAVAAQVSDIRIGHLVLSSEVRHPALLGKMAVTLDRISDGRLDLGLGWGGAPDELAAYGISTDPGALRRAKLAETVAIVRLIMSGGDVTFTGEHYRIRGVHSAPSADQSPVPVFIGGAGAATMALVREQADWWNCPSYARGDLARLISMKGAARVSVNYSIAFEPSSNAPAHVRGERNAPVLVGSPGALAAVLAADRALGVELFNIQFTQVANLTRQMETFIEQVAPAIA